MSWKEKIKKFFAGNRIDKVVNPPEDNFKGIHQNFADVEKQIQIENFTGDDAILSENIQQHIVIYGDSYYEIGLNNGKVGARDFSISKTSDIHAALISDRVFSTLYGRVESLKYAILEKENSLKKVEKEVDQIAVSKADMEQRKVDDSKSFQLFFGFLYVFFGLAMILADVAVSINLVSFFGIGNIDEDASFHDKINDWELLLFSLGIAFCTVYVKILYDEYINSKLGLKLAEIKRLTTASLNKSWLVAETIFKAVVKLFILAGLLYLLYYLAKYRTYFTIMNKQTGVEDSLNQISGISSLTDIKKILLNSFIGITVIIPVISGIALSIGFRIFSNIIALKNITKRHEDIGKKYASGKEEVVILTQRVKKMEKYSEEWMKRDAKIQQISDYFSERYNQGFKVGYRGHFGNDLYMIVEEYRNEMINKELNKYMTNGIK